MPQQLKVGELPVPGKFYVPKHQALKIYKDLQTLQDFEDAQDTEPPSCGLIHKGKLFLFAKVAHEQKVPGEIKKVWFHVVYGELIGICYNGQIPFHQFLMKVTEEDDESIP